MGVTKFSRFERFISHDTRNNYADVISLELRGMKISNGLLYAYTKDPHIQKTKCFSGGSYSIQAPSRTFYSRTTFPLCRKFWPARLLLFIYGENSRCVKYWHLNTIIVILLLAQCVYCRVDTASRNDIFATSFRLLRCKLGRHVDILELRCWLFATVMNQIRERGIDMLPLKR